MILGLDTGGPRCAVALCDADARLLASRDPEIGRGHAERLMGLVAEVMAEAGAAYGDLARIAVTVGPGSFTGLRVGVSAARGLALALGIPAVGVCALEALAEPFREAGPVLAAIDAKRGEIYLGGYGLHGMTREPAAVPVDGLAERLAGEAPGVLVGSGAPVLRDALGWSGVRVENTDNRLDLAALARIALRSAAAEPPSPLYLRGADAKPQGAPILKAEAQKPWSPILP